MSTIIGIIIILLIVLISSKNIYNAYWFGLFIVIAYPNATYVDTLMYTRIFGGLNVMQIVPATLLFAYIFKKHRIRIRRNALSLSLILLLFVYIWGLLISNAALIDVLKDFQKYLVTYFWMILTVSIFRNGFNLQRFEFVLLRALLVNVILGFILFLLRNDIPYTQTMAIDAETNAALLSASSLYLLAICYAIYLLFSAQSFKRVRLELITGLLCFIYLMICTKSRTNIFLILIFYIYILCKYHRNTSRKLAITSLLVVIMIVAFNIFHDTVLIKRITDTSLKLQSLMGNTETLSTRINTFKYYINQIMRAPFGNGFGKKYRFINQYGRYHGYGDFYLDNALINIGLKCGILGMTANLYLFFVLPIYKFYKCNNDISYKMIIYLLIIFSSMVMTSQGSKDYQVSCVVSILCMASCLRKSNSNNNY